MVGVVVFVLVGVVYVQIVKVLLIVDYLVFDVICDGVCVELKVEGYGDDKFKWEYQSVQGNIGMVVQIVCKFVGDKFDVIVVIVMLVVQLVVVVMKSVLVVYLGVIDLVVVQFVKGWGLLGINVMGVFDKLLFDCQVVLIKCVVLNVKMVGMVYNLGEVNLVVVVKEFKEIFVKQGMMLKEVVVLCIVDIGLVVKSLIGKVDVIYMNIDNNVVFVYEVLVKVVNEVKILFVVGDIDSVKCGGIVVFGINYGDFGCQMGKVVVCILKGEKLGVIVLEMSSNFELFVNMGVVVKQGVMLLLDFVKEVKMVIK